MRLPRFSLAATRPAFVPEWGVLVLAGLAELIWARAIGFHMHLSTAAIVTPLLLAVLIVVSRGLGFSRGGLFLEYGALSLVGSFALVVLSYLCMASATAARAALDQSPLVDAQLLAFDRALGFDWLAIWKMIVPHPQLMQAMEWVYDSLLVQSFTVTIFLGLMGEEPAMRNLWRLSTLACAVSCLIAIALPALGPYKVFGLESQAPFLPVMEQLVARHNLNFDSATLRGVIEFPSVHTVLALACTWAVRRAGPLLWLFAGLNLLMLFTIPFMGGHYVADMIGGAAVFAFALWVVRLLERRAHGAPATLAVPAPC